MEENKSFKPIGAKERINVLDALRGFAIFGILIINIGVFSGYSFMPPDMKDQMLGSNLNSFFDWIHAVFFSGKFYTMFSLLFGIGFAIQLMRSSKANRSFLAHFSRRLFFLLLIGVVHLWGIWFGDILVIYAICGFMLILFMQMSKRGLLIAAFIIMLLPGLHSLYLNTIDFSYTDTVYQQLAESWTALNLPEVNDEHQTFQIIDLVKVIQSDSWETVLSFNYIGPLLRGYIVLLDARFFKVLAIFVLGFWTGRQLLENKLHENRSRLIVFAVAGLLIGIPLNIYYAMNSYIGSGMWAIVIKEALTPFAYVSLTTGMIAAFMLLYHTQLRKILTKLFEDVGKTALSNYILQSLLCIFLFYEIGLGLGKYLGSAYLTLAVFIIFVFQILLSTLWLKRYKYGPLEWFWRVLTYGKYIQNKL